MEKIRSPRGFTIVELLVAISLVFILFSIGAVNLSSMRSQMNSGQDIRRLALVLNSLRSEAIRLRTNVRISFNAGGYYWDYYDDGTSEGAQSLSNGSSWFGSTPSSFVFNGLGLARGVSPGGFTVANGDVETSLSVNQNGFISY